MSVYPKDTEQQKISRHSIKILLYTLDSDHWDYKLETGSDVGRDCILELSENDQWKNHKIEGQVKGTQKPVEILNGKYISFPMDVKTINYALQSPIAFVLFVVDTTNEIVYYQPIQQYAIENPGLLHKLSSGQQTVNIRIPKTQVVSENDDDLQRLATTLYKPQEDGLPIAV